MWRRYVRMPPPSHHAICTTCMQLLPLVEMYCKWVLGEDCSSLHALMCRFDSELELESHELGRSLLFMIRDDDEGFFGMLQPPSVHVAANPFADVNERLSAAAMAIRDLHPQVIMLVLPCCRMWSMAVVPTMRVQEF